MFTYKFRGLKNEDATTPYYYGSLPAKPEAGHILTFAKSGNHYTVIKIVGKGLEGDGGTADQERLAVADIVHRAVDVPTLWLSLIEKRKKSIKVIVRPKAKAAKPKKPAKKMPVEGRSFDADEVKRNAQENKKTRFKNPIL